MALHGGFGAVKVGYTGDMIDEIKTINGEEVRLLTLTSSGVLTLSKATEADVWLCDGGNRGDYDTSNQKGHKGGNGGKFGYFQAVKIEKTTTIIVGSEMGTTSVGTLVADIVGSGGGGAGDSRNTNTGLAGGGMSTIPFFDQANFDPHCAGGGGGGWYNGTYRAHGGAGGTDGGNGTTSSNTSSDKTLTGGAGGTRGAGAGGVAYTSGTSAGAGGQGLYYGAASGGAGSWKRYDGWFHGGGNIAYQGVAYIKFKEKKDPAKPAKISYSGDYTETYIEHNGQSKVLYTFVSSGILTVEEEGRGSIWLCDGGMNGGMGGTNSTNTKCTNGGAGGRFLQSLNIAMSVGDIPIVVGAGNGGASQFGNYVARIAGSGGGTGYYSTSTSYYSYGVAGGGVSTIPFNDNVNFLKLCAGGGGGGMYFSEYINYDSDWNVTSVDPVHYSKGGDGGSDGSDGESKTYTEVSKAADAYGAGGADGGGKGGHANYQGVAGSDGTMYGAGGGGCSSYTTTNYDTTYSNWYFHGKHGAGYQGVVYLMMDAV